MSLFRAPCPLCDGAGAINCGEFSLGGEEQPEPLFKCCPECRGKGEVGRRRARLRPEPCTKCRGTGSVEGDSPQTRWQWQMVSRHLVVCPDCSGVGRRLPGGPPRRSWFGWGRLELLAHLSYLLLLVVTIAVLVYRRWFR